MSRTPGPWKIGYGSVDYLSIDAFYPDDDSWWPIATIELDDHGAEPTEEQDANAALIAAAPELLAENVSNLNELKHLHDAIKRLPEGTFGSAPPTSRHAGYPIRDEILHNIAQRIEATEAAIKKAKGTP